MITKAGFPGGPSCPTIRLGPFSTEDVHEWMGFVRFTARQTGISDRIGLGLTPHDPATCTHPDFRESTPEQPGAIAGIIAAEHADGLEGDAAFPDIADRLTIRYGQEDGAVMYAAALEFAQEQYRQVTEIPDMIREAAAVAVTAIHEAAKAHSLLQKLCGNPESPPEYRDETYADPGLAEGDGFDGLYELDKALHHLRNAERITAARLRDLNGGQR